ncbi:putative glutathione S-transferase [Prosthecobacter debontii]|uniref:Putative glutathione S-transferase n=1 Tax=Prosthecobacter debontii TaxID=48467 RepID=A0A1T4WXW3_9BACT|nr:glutathione S-transferase C-terminal domain-containing protein [Prosthecobacter debontii]SKA82223.1 putative glutathione S-transferase [Prosthecobacter debontii]
MAQFPAEQSTDGSFRRQEDAFRRWVVADGSSEFPPEEGRYHLYVSLACPWAHRTLIIRSVLGLEKAIGVTVADPVRDDRGWAFRDGLGHSADQAAGFQFLSEAYLKSDPSFEGRYTVPVLWDTQTQSIVSNSEDDICRMFADGFRAFQRRFTDPFPAHLEDEQKTLSSYIYDRINNAVYKAGFATTQQAYEKAVGELFTALGAMEERLTRNIFLLGNDLTEADWRLFCTLIRFDAVYHGHFKCNLRQIQSYPQLSSYVRCLYQQSGIQQTVNFDHIKRHYFMTHEQINPTRIVPLGPDLTWLDEPSERELRFGSYWENTVLP